MVSIANDVMNALRRAYVDFDGEVDLGLFLGKFGDLDDDELADLIELDARERLRCGKHVDLPRYLEAIPDLPQRRIALDAAIEFALRSLSGSRHTKIEAVEALCQSYPDLVPAISAAWFLNDALGSTGGATALVQPPLEIKVPLGVGPLLASGKSRYELRERLGRGSHGAVYLAVDYSLSEPDRAAWVAVKVTSVSPGAQAVAHRVMEEATKARRVTHPNIARVLDRGALADGSEFVVYEHVDAGDLQDAHDRGRVPRDPRSLAKLVSKVARAVQAAHSAGLIHSDLKPSNILLTSAGEPKVADFGLAARRFDLDQRTEGVQLGTLGFIAPERYRAEPGSEGVASDVYSLGGILYYLLVGAAPNGVTPDAVADRLGADPENARPPSLDAAGVTVDPDLAAICQRALAPRPQGRYASADAFADDLERWLEHRPLAWRKSTRLRLARLFITRNPVLCAAGVAVGILLVGATGAVMSVRHRAEQHRLQMELDAASSTAAMQAETIEEAKQRTGHFATILLAKRGDLTSEWVAFFTVVEAVAGPVLFNSSLDKRVDQIWAARIDVARERIREASASGRANDSDTLLWRIALGFWLNKRGQHAEAVETLRPAATAWKERLGPDDTWTHYAECLILSAEIREAAQRAQQGILSPDARENLARSATALSGSLPYFTGLRRGNNVHTEVIESLVIAYSPGLLDRPAEVAAAQRELNALSK